MAQAERDVPRPVTVAFVVVGFLDGGDGRLYTEIAGQVYSAEEARRLAAERERQSGRMQWRAAQVVLIDDAPLGYESPSEQRIDCRAGDGRD